MFFAASRRNYPLPPTASQEEGPAEDRQFHPAPLARASSQPIAVWEPLRVSVAGRAALTPLPYRQQPRLCRLRGGWGQGGVHRAGAGRGGVGQPEAGGGSVVGEQPLAAADRDREDQQPVLVDQGRPGNLASWPRGRHVRLLLGCLG